jgi:hypothetical protein
MDEERANERLANLVTLTAVVVLLAVGAATVLML